METSNIYNNNYRNYSYLKNYNYYRPNYNSYNSTSSTTSHIETNILNSNSYIDTNLSYKNEKKSKNNFTNFNFDHLLSWGLEEPIFEVFGIKLFLDDLIIIAILFFLYTEGVTDQMVYIALILLIIG